MSPSDLLDQPLVVDAKQLDWTPSPADGVVRKRLKHSGPAESGMVTSLVRYRPASHFDRHYHPDGEEILVLEGVFSDEHGDYPAGSYLLNPDGSGHRPFSEPGCLLLVKLRQYPGQGRQQLALDTGGMAWQALDRPGVFRKQLYRQAGFDERISLIQLRPGTELSPLCHPAGAEIYVLEGAVEDEQGRYDEGCFIQLPPGYCHQPRSRTGCVLYLKQG
ncbi:cupin domain-containing protein [Ferrimonas balearica]|uniref:cupin domain-containing protein n=1 Tax=Ferrimonas balearica TaxID=44012 RepID=UPI001C59F328|nr:cupin domain-containing protein [Ferrimonas balearica]MBW3164087.1 cupin domain-containing protein [Ferrimonas balearica]MBY6224069.1 cupin domain-containing protein [Ferrimonas balearica]